MKKAGTVHSGGLQLKTILRTTLTVDLLVVFSIFRGIAVCVQFAQIAIEI